jgi:hypothetical protein
MHCSAVATGSGSQWVLALRRLSCSHFYALLYCAAGLGGGIGWLAVSSVCVWCVIVQPPLLLPHPTLLWGLLAQLTPSSLCRDARKP